jgi:hypothetical protein
MHPPLDTSVEIFTSFDGLNRIVIAARHDGLYTWRHEVYLPPNPDYGFTEDWDAEYPYGNGIYATREGALQDALGQVKWLHGVLDRCP